jgi:hypothetical protein
LFILILIIMKWGGQPLAALLRERKFEVELGGNKLSIGDAVQALDDETKQSLDDFRKHQNEIETIKKRLDAIDGGSKPIEHKDPDELIRAIIGALQRSGATAQLPTVKSDDDGPKEFGPPSTSPPPGTATPWQPDQDIAMARSHPAPAQPTGNRRELAFQRMLAALSDSRFEWRTIERLAIESGVSESEAHEILAEHSPGQVRLGKSKAGKTIARLVEGR